MSELAVRVEGLGKEYRLGGPRERYSTLRDEVQKWTSLRGLLRRAKRAEHRPLFWALKDVSFEIERGEVVGIIGRNGAGKSTLLKILSRITEPTEGEADIHGRVASLLEVGTGFHPELTGRENVYLNGAILGMRRAEIARKFDDIVGFAEVEKFVDTPVKHYSSGMYMRLAFAVAAHLEPEILIVDEVLAVGDAEFQKKCLGKMESVAESGRTVLFVSHNLAAMEHLCHRALLLEYGKVSQFGAVQPVTERYITTQQTMSRTSLAERTDREGNSRVRFIGIAYHVNGRRTECLKSGQQATFAVSYNSNCSGPGQASVSLGIFTLSGQCLAVLGNEMAGIELACLNKSGQFRCIIPRLPLTPGTYQINLYCEVSGVLADWVRGAATVYVEGGDYFGTGRLPPASHGGVLIDQFWTIADETEE